MGRRQMSDARMSAGRASVGPSRSASVMDATAGEVPDWLDEERESHEDRVSRLKASSSFLLDLHNSTGIDVETSDGGFADPKKDAERLKNAKRYSDKFLDVLWAATPRELAEVGDEDGEDFTVLKENTLKSRSGGLSYSKSAMPEWWDWDMPGGGVGGRWAPPAPELKYGDKGYVTPDPDTVPEPEPEPEPDYGPPPEGLCEGCLSTESGEWGGAPATHGLPVEQARRWCEACAVRHQGAVQMEDLYGAWRPESSLAKSALSSFSLSEPDLNSSLSAIVERGLEGTARTRRAKEMQAKLERLRKAKPRSGPAMLHAAEAAHSGDAGEYRIGTLVGAATIEREDLAELKALYRKHDPDDVGLRSPAFVALMNRVAIADTREELAVLFRKMDGEGSGRLVCELFLSYLLMRSTQHEGVGATGLLRQIDDHQLGSPRAEGDAEPPPEEDEEEEGGMENDAQPFRSVEGHGCMVKKVIAIAMSEGSVPGDRLYVTIGRPGLRLPEDGGPEGKVQLWRTDGAPRHHRALPQSLLKPVPGQVGAAARGDALP